MILFMISPKWVCPMKMNIFNLTNYKTVSLHIEGILQQKVLHLKGGRNRPFYYYYCSIAHMWELKFFVLKMRLTGHSYSILSLREDKVHKHLSSSVKQWTLDYIWSTASVLPITPAFYCGVFIISGMSYSSLIMTLIMFLYSGSVH